jgi:hypothetical protein
MMGATIPGVTVSDDEMQSSLLFELLRAGRRFDRRDEYSDMFVL